MVRFSCFLFFYAVCLSFLIVFGIVALFSTVFRSCCLSFLRCYSFLLFVFPFLYAFFSRNSYFSSIFLFSFLFRVSFFHNVFLSVRLFHAVCSFFPSSLHFLDSFLLILFLYENDCSLIYVF